jgi:hypothetical protein
MADNLKFPGFRWSQSANGGKAMPAPMRYPVATAYQGTINGGSNIDINIGDPVKLLSTGYVAHSGGSESSGGNADNVFGIVVGIAPYWNGSVMTPSNVLPGGQGSYGTNFDRQSFVYVIPASAGTFEIDCDDSSTATTYAAYLALVGENTDHVLTTGSEPKTNCMLDISLHGTSTAQWRIVQISTTAANQDFSGKFVKLWVQANEGQQSIYTATGV